MKTDHALQEGFKVFASPEERIVYLTFFSNEEASDDNVRATELVIEGAQKALEACGGETCVALVDTVAVPEGVRVVFPESRTLYAKFIADERIQKVAFLGSNDFIASLIGTIGELIGDPSKIKWFSDVEEAKSWLKE